MKLLIPVSLLTLVLASGCGTADSDDEPAAAADSSASASTEESAEQATSEATASASAKEVKPASGKTYQLDGLTLTTPRGWSDVGERQTPDTVLSVMHTGVDDTPERLWVRRLTPDAGRSATARSARAQLEEIGATKVAQQETVEVAGATASYSTAARSEGGVDERFHQYVIAGDQATWVLTFSINRWQQRPDPQQVLDSVLATVQLG